MILEHRSYLPVSGRERDLEARFRDSTMALFARHGIRVLHFWAVRDTGELIYICEWPSVEAMREGWERFRQDPDWMRVKQQTEAGGAIVERIESKILGPVDFFAP